MKRLSVFLLTGVGVAVAAAYAQSTPPTPTPSAQQSTIPSAAPSRVIKFFEADFSDPTSWSCVSGQSSTGGAQTDSCRACTNTGNNTADITVVHAPDSTQETVSVATGAGIELCRDVLIVEGATVGSSAPTAETTPMSGMTPMSANTPTLTR